MVILGWILRVLLIMFVLRLILRALFPARRRPMGPRPRQQPLERAGGTLVQDPHCGTYLPKTRAIVSGAGESARYFCSVECRDRFLAGQPRRHAS